MIRRPTSAVQNGAKLRWIWDVLLAKTGSIVPLGRSYFPHHPRHFVPGYYRAVPPGQKT